MPAKLAKKIPNTNIPVNGHKPGHIAYAFMVSEDICTNCRARWVEGTDLLCERCEAALSSYRATRHHRKTMKDVKRPTSVELVLTKDLSGQGFALTIFSDVGKLLTVRKLDGIDIRDARRGKAHLTSFRPAA